MPFQRVRLACTSPPPPGPKKNTTSSASFLSGSTRGMVNCLKRIWVAGSSFQEAGTLEVRPSMVTGVPAAAATTAAKRWRASSCAQYTRSPCSGKLPPTVYALG